MSLRCVSLYRPDVADPGWSAWVGDPLGDGWLEVSADALPGRLYLHFEADEDGRLRPVDLFLAGGEPITAKHLRNLPIHRLEADANSLLADQLRPSEDSGMVVDVRAVLTEVFAKLAAAQPLRARRKAVREGRLREPVQRPQGRDRPDVFYQSVAAAYADAVRNGLSPGKVIAEEAAVSPRTAQGWVAEARRRGFLPPARQGSVG